MSKKKAMFFRGKEGGVPVFQLTTTSTSSTWKPKATKTGEIITWTVTGDASGVYVNDNPTIDLSGNTGTAIITATASDWLTTTSVINISSASNVPELITAELTIFEGTVLSNFTLSISSLPDMTSLVLPLFEGGNQLNLQNNDSLIDLDLKNIDVRTSFQCQGSANLTNITNINLASTKQIQAFGCNISYFDVSTCTSCTLFRIQNNNQTAAVTDQTFQDMVTANFTNAAIRIRNNRTAASDANYATLLANGCTFQFYST